MKIWYESGLYRVSCADNGKPSLIRWYGNVDCSCLLNYIKNVLKSCIMIMTWWHDIDTGDVLRSCDCDLVTWNRWCPEKLRLWFGDMIQVICWEAVIMTWWHDTGDVLRSCDCDLVTWYRWCPGKLRLWLGDMIQVICWEAVIMTWWHDTGDVLRSCEYDLVTWHKWCAEKLWLWLGDMTLT